MSCKSGIYIVNSSATTLAVGSTVPLGTVIRRFGRNIQLAGNGITIEGQGYYAIEASITVSPTAVGTVTVTMLKDGIAVPGAFASEATSAANNPVNLNISALLREQCCDNTSTITFVLTGTAATLNNIAVVVEKL